jgi:hypothetical protein
MSSASAVLNEDVEVTVVVEDAGIQQLRSDSFAPLVSCQLIVGKSLRYLYRRSRNASEQHPDNRTAL